MVLRSTIAFILNPHNFFTVLWSVFGLFVTHGEKVTDQFPIPQHSKRLIVRYFLKGSS